MINSLRPTTHEPLTEEERKADSTIVLGFWIYLMTDLVLFASLFAVYAVLRGNTFGGPSTVDIFSAPLALIETLLLLTSSFVSGLTLVAARTGKRSWVLGGLGSTALLGASFLYLELAEFTRLIAAGNGSDGPWRSGFLSSYFTLVGTHGLHIAIGLLWIVALMVSIGMRGLTRANMRKLMLWSLFWHFLDVVWIFIFVIVYMMGIS